MSTENRAKIYVIGVGMTKFVKPGAIPGWDYPDMVKESVSQALNDAKLKYTDIEQAVTSFVYGQTCSGQRALYPLGMTGIPIYNVNNACASGSSALNLARQILLSGESKCLLAVGFEKMKIGSLDGMSTLDGDSVHPVDKHVQVMANTFGIEPAPITAQMFGNAAREHMTKYGTKAEHFAKVAWKNHKHSVHNERSQFQKEYSLQGILESKMIHDPLTKLQCCPTSDGSAAAILCTGEFLADKPHLRSQAVEIAAMVMATDLPSTFAENSNLKMIGFDAVQKSARELYKKSNVKPTDVQVIELHDCFSANELITYEALGLCPLGGAASLIDRGDNTYGGKWVINPSGGLISKGHPLGATGIAQCAELCWQLRHLCGKRQVPNAKIAMQHNIGIGGAVVLAIYKLGFDQISSVNDVIKTPSSKPFKSDIIFEQITSRSEQDLKKLAADVQSVIAFRVTKDACTKIWVLNLSKFPVRVDQYMDKNPGGQECEIAMNDSDMFDVASGKSNPQMLFMSGKLKVKGNFAKAMKLQNIFRVDAQNVKSNL